MRKLYILVIVLVFTMAGFSQQVDNKTTTENKTTEKTTDTTGTGDTGNSADNKTAEKQKLPDGYGNLTWGMYLSDAKDKIAGSIAYTDDKKIIISKDGYLEYKYGFFYKDPEVVGEDKPAGDTEKKADNTTTDTTTDKTSDNNPGNIEPSEKDEGILFYVSLSFPYLDKDTVYNKIKNRYGVHTGENIKDDKGAIVWVNDETIIIMWVDTYRKKQYCRRVTYLSRKISKELNEYSANIFNKAEQSLIKAMKF